MKSDPFALYLCANPHKNPNYAPSPCDPLRPARGCLTGLLLMLALWLLVLIALTGCEDKAFPLDCPNACGHRVAQRSK